MLFYHNLGQCRSLHIQEHAYNNRNTNVYLSTGKCLMDTLMPTYLISMKSLRLNII